MKTSEWFIENKIYVNPDEFQAILLNKQKSYYTGTKLTVGSEEIQVVSSVDVLSVTIDDKLNFKGPRSCLRQYLA